MGARYKAKICGTTNLKDAELAATEGADYFGVVVDVTFSPRSLSIEEASVLFAAPPIPGVALVFHMEAARVETLIRQLNPFGVQFLNPADPLFIRQLKQRYPEMELWQSLHLPKAGEIVDRQHFQQSVQTYVAAGIDSLVFDTAAMSKDQMKFGGTGLTSDWEIVKDLMRSVRGKVPVWLAGGIHPGNVAEALDRVDPHGIDLCSGVEAAPGRKDPEKIRSLMQVIRGREKPAQ
jgi:phosphoribosylanthranilate isomerase